MNNNPLLPSLKILLVLLFIGLSGCATSPPEETGKPVTMATTTPIYKAKKIYFVFEVSVETGNTKIGKPITYDSLAVKNWTAFASQMVKEVKAAGVDADFVINIAKIDDELDLQRSIHAPNDASHVVHLVEVRTKSRGTLIVEASWEAVVYQNNIGKKWDDKSQLEKISLYKYNYVGGACYMSLVSKSADTDCVKKHTSFHLDNLKKVGIL